MTHTARVKADGDYYLKDGRRYLRVTAPLKALAKPALIQWAANVERDAVMTAAGDVYTRFREGPPLPTAAFLTLLDQEVGKVRQHKKLLAKGGDIGTEAHAYLEWWTRGLAGVERGPEPIVQDRAMWAVMAAQDWFRAHEVTPVLIEGNVWSDRFDLAGTLDLLADVDGERAVIDYKTGKGIYAEAHLQNVAYRVLAREMGLCDGSAGYIIRLPKNLEDPEVEVAAAPPLEPSWSTYQAIRVVWEWWQAAEDASRAAWQARKAVAHG